MAQPDRLVEGAYVLYLKAESAPPARHRTRRPTWQLVEPSPAAVRLAGDLLIQALLHESAERSE
jgi:hypothetical protein